MRILCLVLCLSCSPFPKATERNVVVSSESSSGSGVVVMTNRVLTNYHLVDKEGEEVTVDNRVAQVIAVDKAADLALIVTVTKSFKKLRLRRPEVGQAVFYVANPTGHVGTLSQGHVLYKDHKHTLTDTIPLPGMSGGGLYNKRGELVGLNVAMEGHPSSGRHMAAHIPIEVVERFLKENLDETSGR